MSFSIFENNSGVTIEVGDGFNDANYKQITDEEGRPMKIKKAKMPPHCGNCKWNEWNEDGPHCRHIDKATGINKDPEFDWGDGGDIRYDYVCDKHEKGAVSRIKIYTDADMKKLKERLKKETT